MFQAAREYFARPEEARPIRGRGRRLSSLFLFEFVVVVLGVLAAQLLQDWFGRRAEERRANEAVAAFEQEAQQLATTSAFRVRTHECEANRLQQLIRVARAGASATLEQRAMPLMPMPVITPWEEGTRSAVRRHAAPEVLQRFDALRVLATMMGERQRRLEDQWADFRLLDPAAGPVAPESRAALALAGARSMGLLYAIDMNAELVIGSVKGFKVEEARMQAISKLDHPCAKSAAVPVSKAPQTGIRV
jgi:hypothetical protein